MPEPTSRCVFVYGTLRKGDDNDITRLEPAPRFVGAGTIAGTMVHLGSYPGVRLGGEGLVHGEVYEIEPALERVLDVIEELSAQPSSEYFKREVVVRLASGPRHCIVYEINPEYAKGHPVIASGDWRAGR